MTDELKVSQEQIEAVTRAQLTPFAGDVKAYEAYQVDMKDVADRVRRDKRIEQLREDLRLFTEAIENEIQELLGMR